MAASGALEWMPIAASAPVPSGSRQSSSTTSGSSAAAAATASFTLPAMPLTSRSSSAERSAASASATTRWSSTTRTEIRSATSRSGLPGQGRLGHQPGVPGNPEAELGSRPHDAGQLQPAAGHLGPLAHRGEPEVPGARLDLVHLEADSIVLHAATVAALRGLQPDLHRVGLGVLADVRERLLDDPEEDGAGLQRRLLGDLGFELADDPRSQLELVQVGPPRGRQAGSLQVRGTAVEHEAPTP